MIGFLFGGLRDLVLDLMGALEKLLEPGPRSSRIVPGLLGLAVAWLLYVPAHELLHAAGCLAAGGEVTEVTLAPLYGGGILERVVPFVVSSTDGPYAGRVTGFDTKGSDLTYLAMDFAPFLLTILIGVPLLRRLARSPSSSGRAWLFGPAVILAVAPILSLTGDYFEMGTVLATNLPGWTDRAHLRSDDLFRLAAEIARGEVEAGASGLMMVAFSCVLAVVLASWTCRLGIAWEAIWGRKRESPSS